MAFLIAFIVTIVMTIIGGGGGYLFYVKTRPKKEIWDARVYQLSDGVKNVKIGKDGDIKGKFSIKDLIPYTKDVLEKVEKEQGVTIFRLKKLNKPTPAVEAGCAEMWTGGKEVSVLYHEGSCTLLKSGYEPVSGARIFIPLPHHRINNIKSEMAIRKDRLRKEKDILEAISPWVVAAILMMGIIFIGYMMTEAFITISENIKEVQLAAMDQCTGGGQKVTPLPKTNPGSDQNTPPTLEEY